jgi:hypothetical protein
VLGFSNAVTEQVFDLPQEIVRAAGFFGDFMQRLHHVV